MAGDDLVRIGCGTDRFAAETVLARCRAEGLQVELLTHDGNLNAMHPLRREHELLVHAADATTVQSLMDHGQTEEKRRRLARARRRRTGS